MRAVPLGLVAAALLLAVFLTQAPEAFAALSAPPVVVKGALAFDTGQGRNDREFCAIQGSGALTRDLSWREVPLSDAANASKLPDETERHLTVSGESEREFRDDREWTRLAFLRFPDWKALCELPENASVTWSWLKLYYDDAYYDARPELNQTIQSHVLYAADLRNPWENGPTGTGAGLSWRDIQAGPWSYFVNATTHDGNAQANLGGQFPCRLPNFGQAHGCVYFNLDFSGGCSVAARFNPASDSCYSLVDDVNRGWRNDYGYAILPCDALDSCPGFNFNFGGGSSDVPPEPGDRGACTDPTHPPNSNADEQVPPPPPPPADSTCLHVFHSADAPGGGVIETQARCADFYVPEHLLLQYGNAWVCWPKFVLHYDRNAPTFETAQTIYNKTRSDMERPALVAFGNESNVQVAVDLRDDWGAVREVTMHVATSVNGAERVFYDNVPLTRLRSNNTHVTDAVLAKCQCERTIYARQGPLGLLPDGQYWVNFTAEDTDANRGFANSSAPNLLIRNHRPTVANFSLNPASFAQKETLNFTVSIHHPERAVPIENVLGEVRRATSDGSKGPLVRTVKAAPIAGQVDPMRHGNWTFQGPFGRFNLAVETPGRYQLWVVTNDTLGRARTALGGEFTVRDIFDPQIDRVVVDTPATLPGDSHVQEAGGPLRVRVEAIDPENPTPLEVKLTLAKSGAAPVLRTLAAVADGVYETRLVAPAAGEWTGRIVARDGEGREDASTFTLLTLAPSDPEVRTAAPRTWSNATPIVSAQVFDYTANASKVRLFVGEPEATREVTPVVSGRAPLLTVSLAALPNLKHGVEREVRLEATDDLGRTNVTSWRFKVDARVPSRTDLLPGEPREERAGKLTVRPDTPFSLKGADADSGGVAVRWRVVDVARDRATEWTPYAAPFTIGGTLVWRDPGPYRIEFGATDAVGNAEELRHRNVTVDGRAPTLAVAFDGLTLRVTSTDEGALADVRVFHRNATEVGWNEVAVPIVDLGNVDATIDLRAVARGVGFRYYAHAVDKVGNRAALGTAGKPVEVVAPNHAPVLDARAPANGTVANATVEIPWAARDYDGDNVRVQFQIRPVVLPDFRDLGLVAGTRGVFRWDTRDWPDGTYEGLLLASDGAAVSRHTFRVEVKNSAIGAAPLHLPGGRVEFTDPVTFELTIYKAVRDVKVRILDAEGRLVEEVALRDDGTAGDRRGGDRVFSASYTPPTKGAYTATLVVAYENEAPRETQLAAFTVEASLARSLQRNAVPIVLGVAVAAGVAAALVVQLMRYGYLFPKE